jgi:pentatricopeptide repeat protein
MLDHRPKRPSAAAAASPTAKRARDPSAPSFPMYKDAPDLPPKICLLCEILASGTIVVETSAALDDTDVRITTTDVERVLRFSYTHARASVAFFRWAGHRHLGHEHSPYAWNLVVDILGKNRLFDLMWDTVASMRSQGLLSFATFTSVFSSLAAPRSRRSWTCHATAWNVTHPCSTRSSPHSATPISSTMPARRSPWCVPRPALT